jgi:hypothetical protein
MKGSASLLFGWQFVKDYEMPVFQKEPDEVSHKYPTLD